MLSFESDVAVAWFITSEAEAELDVFFWLNNRLCKLAFIHKVIFRRRVCAHLCLYRLVSAR